MPLSDESPGSNERAAYTGTAADEASRNEGAEYPCAAGDEHSAVAGDSNASTVRLPDSDAEVAAVTYTPTPDAYLCAACRYEYATFYSDAAARESDKCTACGVSLTYSNYSDGNKSAINYSQQSAGRYFYKYRSTYKFPHFGGFKFTGNFPTAGYWFDFTDAPKLDPSERTPGRNSLASGQPNRDSDAEPYTAPKYSDRDNDSDA